ncbi:MAG: TOTE conflict system archaeo-eukaryotic primase domain-containing protein [Pirellulaceae bacterium]
MSDPSFHERIAGEWRERAPELADWTMRRLVNRTDVWGRYLKKRHRTNTAGEKNNAITAPFRNERGKVFLGCSSLEKHFKAKDGGGVLGLHSSGSDGSSRWFAIDIDLHDDDDLSVTREGNFVAARAWWQQLVDFGFDPLFIDSNGRGGYHIWVIFEHPMDSKTVRKFAEQMVSNFDVRGLDAPPDLFPGNYRYGSYGSWLRLPGRHHTHQHFSRIWNDELWDEDNRWLEGHDAVDRILRTRPANLEICERAGLERRRKTVCLDFDGVIHSYHSGWKGETVIPDPPIHRVDQAIRQLRKHFRVVVYSARCRSDEGMHAVANWLAKHNIEVDEVCRNKPPAHIYIDDRAIPFTGDWDDTIASIHEFRK